MSRNVLHPQTCSYVKGILWELSVGKTPKNLRETKRDCQSRARKEQFTKYNEVFRDHLQNFEIEFLHFRNSIVELRDKVAAWGKTHSKTRRNFLPPFRWKPGKIFQELKYNSTQYTTALAVCDKASASLGSSQSRPNLKTTPKKIFSIKPVPSKLAPEKEPRIAIAPQGSKLVNTF